LLKELVLKNHTLEAVVSLPEGLFHNSKVAVVTCAVIIRAHIPHPKNKETWFGYWRNDGYTVAKYKGRIDKYNRWPQIKETWINAYNNRKEIGNFSIMKKVTPLDEWCAEAYLQTDYSSLTENDFVHDLKKYMAFKLLASE
jgi:type I restriction enzyme M protein